MVLEFFAEVLYLGINKVKIIRIVHVVAPHVLRKCRLVNKPVLIDHKERQNIELLPVQVNVRTGDAQRPCIKVELHAVQSDNVTSTQCLATYHSFNPCIEFSQVKWLR